MRECGEVVVGTWSYEHSLHFSGKQVHCLFNDLKFSSQFFYQFTGALRVVTMVLPGIA